MQPARKLLSLLFLVLMGTELTQVRAFNAIFLRACEAPARPPASPAKSGSRSAQPVPPAPAPEPRGWGGGRWGADEPRLAPSVPGPPALAQRGCTAGPLLPAEKFQWQREGVT